MAGPPVAATYLVMFISGAVEDTSTILPKYAAFATPKPPAVLSDAAVVLVASVTSVTEVMPVAERVPVTARPVELMVARVTLDV
jgi:hypothetical protein